MYFSKLLPTSLVAIVFLSFGGAPRAQSQTAAAAPAAQSAVDAAQAALNAIRSQEKADIDSICTDGSTFENSECLSQVLNATNNTIKKVMLKVHVAISSNEDMPLDIRVHWTEDANAAQKAWAVYRNKECERIIYQSFGGGGGGAGNMLIRCKITKTLERIEEIQHDYDLTN